MSIYLSRPYSLFVRQYLSFNVLSFHRPMLLVIYIWLEFLLIDLIQVNYVYVNDFQAYWSIVLKVPLVSFHGAPEWHFRYH